MSKLTPLKVTDKIELISVDKLILNELSLKTYSTPNNYEEKISIRKILSNQF